MDTKFEKDIQNIFQQHSESPSPECWSKLSNRLDAVYNQAPSTGGNAVSTVGKILQSTIGKVSMGVAVVGAIGTTVYFVATTNEENNDTQNQISVEDIQEITTEKEDTVFVVDNELKTTTVEDRNETKIVSEKDKNSVAAPIIAETKIEKTTPNTTENINKTVDIQPVKQQAVLPAKEVLPAKKEVSEKAPIPTAIAKEESIAKGETIDKEVKEAEEEIMQPRFNIPNIFTPNGDNVNDYFVIEAVEGVTNGHLYIYSVTGKVLYERENYQNDFNGEYLADGLYLYIYKFIYKDKEFIRKGTITIKRD